MVDGCIPHPRENGYVVWCVWAFLFSGITCSVPRPCWLRAEGSGFLLVLVPVRPYELYVKSMGCLLVAVPFWCEAVVYVLAKLFCCEVVCLELVNVIYCFV